MKNILLSVLFLAGLCVQQTLSAQCNFVMDPFFGYTCQLMNAVTTEPGQELEIDTSGHLGSNTDANVRCILTINTTSLEFYPQNLLEVFPNTYYLLLEGSGLTELAPITNCQNVGLIHITDSHVQEIPAGIFDECEALRILDMHNNEISEIDDDAFETLVLLYELNLAQNRITRITTPLFRNLVEIQDLYLNENQIAEIEDDAFVNLHELIIFYLRRNRLTEFNPRMFGDEIDLVFFSLADNLLTRVPQLPAIAPRIKYIILDRNRIDVINDGDFTFSYSNVTDIELNENLLTVLDATAFSVLERLDILSVSYNRINAIDNELFDRIPSLYTFYFERNYCANARFNNIRSRDQFEIIDRTFDHCYYEFFQPQRDVSCNFVNRTDTGYTCEIDNLEFLNFRNKFNLTGTHNGGSNSGVESVVIRGGSMVRIPPTIFRTFNNLQTFVANHVGLSVVNQDTFIECGLITRLDLASNRIRRLPSSAFRNCNSLEHLILDDNQLTAIHPCDSFLTNIYLVRTISMRGNICVDRTIIHTYQDSILEYLDMVFNPFVRNCFGLWYTMDITEGRPPSPPNPPPTPPPTTTTPEPLHY